MMQAGSQIARGILLNANDGSFQIDGNPIPWAITPEIDISDDQRFVEVTVTFYADAVTLIGRGAAAADVAQIVEAAVSKNLGGIRAQLFAKGDL